ncbi:MAG: tetratricopeptide repeat protein [Candidatus Eisenbacteria bacterium]|nr:tetratricopeptide repeat protein [Candidatus Eisenbacteria bacterium]
MTVRSIVSGVALASVLSFCLASLAAARNEHCAGGIQYVVQAMHDKDKGNTDDYRREINKAVDQLQQCEVANPEDFEAMGYLGWAYAEVDSAGPAGVAFQRASAGLRAKGDTKKAEWVANNRDSYWANRFNDGIAKFNTATQACADYNAAPASDADKILREEAARNCQQAITSFTRASLLKPGNPQTLRNLGSVYAYLGEYRTAETVFDQGLKIAPGDSTLALALRSVRANYAGQLIEQKKYDAAIAYYADLIKGDPENADLHLGQADAYFKRASEARGDAAKPDYKLAADAYAKAGALKTTDADLPFNSALSYQNAGEWALAEAQWKVCLTRRAGDIEATSALAQTLSEQKKFDEALKVLQPAVVVNPKNKTLHRQLGAVYTKMGNNPKSTEELMVYLALQNGKPVADAAAAAKAAPAGSVAARTLASMGTPEQVVPWEVDQQKIETWFYWSKNQAFHFQGGTLYGKSDWSSTAPATATPSGKK